MLQTLEEKTLKSNDLLQKIKIILPMQIGNEATDADLINYEAGIVFLEEMIKWLETLTELRKTATDNHFEDVEIRVNQLGAGFLENSKQELQAIVNAWGKRPFEDAVHEKGIYK
jgi:hypothetical protein